MKPTHNKITDLYKNNQFDKNYNDNNITNCYLDEINKFKINILSQLLEFLGNSINDNIKKGIILKLNDRFDEIYDAYSITVKKYKYRQRDSGEMYITHINGVLEIYIKSIFNLSDKFKYLDNNKEKDRKKAIEFVKNEISIIATIIEHDSIEDTDATMEGINERYTSNKLVGFTTFLLSKKPYNYFINNYMDKNEFEYICGTGIFNEKLQVSDRIKHKIELNEKDDDILIKYSMGDDHELTEIEKDGLKRNKILGNKFKKIKNEIFFQDYKSIFSLIKKGKIYINKKNIKFSRDDFKIIIYNTIVIKLSDRIHNLNDIAIAWKEKPDKIEEKLAETEKYLLPLAKEFNSEIYEYMKNKIFEIRNNITKIDIINLIEFIIK